VRVRPRQVLKAENHSVSWPQEERTHTEHPPIGGTDNDNEQPDRLPLSLGNRMNEPDDQVELHINCMEDDDGVLDCDDDDGTYLDMSDWESD
jgi:hypothetical protein